ncbi:hypothetical protein MK079_03490 [Candidatus Gracilibacteria bacterium]|nr:hypothetical protein [Candidatus Gracilibacteria bacterium]
MNIAKKVFYTLSSVWIMYIFLGSLPYKFSGHEHTQNIFGTIGDWMMDIFPRFIGQGFVDYGAYIIGGAELVVSLVLLAGIIGIFMKKAYAEKMFAFGGLGASLIMLGAVFFHLFTPLGIEVNGDGGSLFRAAVSILILGSVMFKIYFFCGKCCKK